MSVQLHPGRDYSGGLFGAPKPRLLSKSWRLKRGILAPDAYDAVLGASVLLGQDAISVPSLASGLAVYGGYNTGTFDNWAELVARFGKSGAKLVSITPWVAPAACLDIEPGNASPSSAPAFQRQYFTGIASKPIYYCSAGDAQAVINALAGAGFGRSTYFLFLAHWLFREHICAPSVCGYPRADATQYASVIAYDSDAWYSYVFAAAPPPAVSYPAPGNLKVTGGYTSVKATWSRPAVPAGLSTDVHYDVFIRRNGGLLKYYPKTGLTETSYESGGLIENTAGYELSVVATGPNGANFDGSKAASASFRTYLNPNP
jgi:hypothetical protein